MKEWKKVSLFQRRKPLNGRCEGSSAELNSWGQLYTGRLLLSCYYSSAFVLIVRSSGATPYVRMTGGVILFSFFYSSFLCAICCYKTPFPLPFIFFYLVRGLTKTQNILIWGSRIDFPPKAKQSSERWCSAYRRFFPCFIFFTRFKHSAYHIQYLAEGSYSIEQLTLADPHVSKIFRWKSICGATLVSDLSCWLLWPYLPK